MVFDFLLLLLMSFVSSFLAFDTIRYEAAFGISVFRRFCLSLFELVFMAAVFVTLRKYGIF